MPSPLRVDDSSAYNSKSISIKNNILVIFPLISWKTIKRLNGSKYQPCTLRYKFSVRNDPSHGKKYFQPSAGLKSLWYYYTWGGPIIVFKSCVHPLLQVNTGQCTLVLSVMREGISDRWLLCEHIMIQSRWNNLNQVGDRVHWPVSAWPSAST